MNQTQTDNTTFNLSHLETLQTFLRGTGPMLMISGTAGKGKTALLTALISRIRISRPVIRLRGSASMHPAQLIKVLSKHWAAKVNNPDAKLEEQFYDILLGLTEHDQYCVLAIDDAHLLPFSMMAALSHLAVMQDNMSTHLHIILAGEADLIKKMQSLQTHAIPVIDLNTTPAATQIESAVNRTSYIAKHGVKTFASLSLIAITGLMWWFFNRPMTSPHPQVAATTAPISAPQHFEKPLSIAAAAIKKMPPSHVLGDGYIIQIMSGANKKALTRFQKRHHLTTQTQTLATTYHHKPWYILSYGHYKSYAKAKNDLHKLPPGLKKHHPWIRPDGNVHT